MPTILASDGSVILSGLVWTLQDLDGRQAASRGNWHHYKAVDGQQRAAAEEAELANQPE